VQSFFLRVYINKCFGASARNLVLVKYYLEGIKMKKILSLGFVASILLATAACSSHDDKGVYADDRSAPYADERTVGTTQVVKTVKAVKTADKVFETRLVK
tara:strand:+ start:124262 stop:124564 length:303 start_codon:yes stop_codon:yes gene_type:complete